MVDDSILDKIRKLKAKAEGTDNEEEAALFAAKVAELLQKHGLEEAALRDIGDDEMVQEKYEPQYFDSWHRALCSMTARVYFCKIYVFNWDEKIVNGIYRSKKGCAFVGRPNNVIIAKEMADYLIATTRRLGQEYGLATNGNREGAAARQFMRGCAERLIRRLYDMIPKDQPVKRGDGNPGNLPALYMSELALADQWIKDFLGAGAKRAGRGFSNDGHHAAMGDAAGRNVNLGPQVGGSKGNLLK